MKKIINFYTNHNEEFLAFLIINVIALLLIDIFKSNTNLGVKDLLTACAAVASTFFLYLAFRETTRQHFYKILEQQVTEMTEMVKHQVFINTTSLFTSEEDSIMRKCVTIRYNKFIYPIKTLFNELEQNSDYKLCILLMGEEQKINLASEIALKLGDLQKTLSIIHDNIVKIFTFYIDMTNLYMRIDKFNINSDLKALLVARLNASINEYFLLFEAPDEYALVTKFLSEFAFFEISDNKLKKRILVYI